MMSTYLLQVNVEMQIDAQDTKLSPVFLSVECVVTMATCGLYWVKFSCILVCTLHIYFYQYFKCVQVPCVSNEIYTEYEKICTQCSM